MKKLLLNLALIASSCTIAESSQAVEVSNFKSGLVCPQKAPNNDNKSNGQICFETETVNITGQGTCVYNGNRERCTWYGYEFDYKNASSDQIIKCQVTSSEIGTYGNPQEIVKEETNTLEYELLLESKEGHFYNPQYSGFTYSTDGNSVSTDGNSVKTQETICFADEREVFRFIFKLIYPRATE